jgi:proteasome lid subunit RPN8/RPN11
MPFRLQIPLAIYDQMIAQARAELPNECVGLLAGRLEAEDSSGSDIPIRRVLQCYPLANAAASPKEYLADGKGLLHAHRDMRQRGLEILAIYHSHPASEPVPSPTDLERNYNPDVIHLIISLRAAEPLVRGWWLTERDSREATWEHIDGQ